ncbi:hypothetical protein C2S52_018563 [Perilla frutescens var. hirtella]|nr:hypothetical protein C2S52_018563 [Perilla frutescens var. hirtella]
MLFDDEIPSCFKMADLGCSSGPNILSIISYIIHTIEEMCIEKKCSHLPEYEVFLNDLPENDFNNLFKMLPSFYPDKECLRRSFISGLPGSFYGRLIPSKSLNFVYSSFSLHWLSQVPEGVENNGKNVHTAMTSPPEVLEAYAKQFETDFSTFLRSRGEEMLGRGRMVLLFVARSAADPSTKDDCQLFMLLANTLAEMATQGVIKEGDLRGFNLPIYPACKEEVEAVIRREGSFNLDAIDSFRIPWDAHVSDSEVKRRGELVSNFVRAFTEPVLAAHFGTSIMNDLFQSYANKLAHHLSTTNQGEEERPSFFHFILTLTKN